jgi:hypothetical protein
MSQTTITPFRVQKHLAGLRYPARKHDVLSRARESGADERVLKALERIADREYPSPVALSSEVGRPG